MTTLARPVAILKPVGENVTYQYRHPSNIIKCRSKEELAHLLDWYSCPFIKQRLPDSLVARRRFVEQVRPALRWFCKRYHVDVPGWLKGNAHYEDMAGDEAKDFFGDGPLQVFEFDQQQPVEKSDRLVKGLTAKDYLDELKQQCKKLKLDWSVQAKFKYDGKTYDFVKITKKSDGPVILIRAGVHGNEVAGPLTIHERLADIVKLANKHGFGLVIYPLANPSGFELGHRYSKFSKKGDDFVRYEIYDNYKGSVKNAPSSASSKWKFTWDADPDDALSQETAAMTKEVRSTDWSKVAAVLDLHQDYLTRDEKDRPASSYFYVYGDKSKYKHLADASAKLVPFYKETGEPSDEKVGKDGFIVSNDGSFADAVRHLGVKHSIVIETTGKTELQTAIAVNMIWIDGIMQMAAKEKPVASSD